MVTNCLYRNRAQLSPAHTGKEHNSLFFIDFALSESASLSLLSASKLMLKKLLYGGMHYQQSKQPWTKFLYATKLENWTFKKTKACLTDIMTLNWATKSAYKRSAQDC